MKNIVMIAQKVLSIKVCAKKSNDNKRDTEHCKGSAWGRAKETGEVVEGLSSLTNNTTWLRS